jgi:hypothetical protein
MKPKAKAKKTIEMELEDELAALSPDRVRLKRPLHVLLGEAIDIVRFCERYWHADREPKTGAILRRGLELAGERHLGPAIAQEIKWLEQATQAAQVAYLLAVEAPRPETLLERARFVLAEIGAAIKWLFDDGGKNERDAQLAAIIAAHRDDPDSEDALASELADYAGLAERYREELDGLGGFSAEMIDEGRALANAVRQRSGEPPSQAKLMAARLLERRNRLATLLAKKVGRVRAAARFVFRHDPSIVRQVTSAYERRKRAERRRAAGAGRQVERERSSPQGVAVEDGTHDEAAA